jgi:hypothetical protein
MAADKTILQLLSASNLSVNDTGVIVQNGTTENYALQLLVDLIAASVSLGSLITFGTTIPTGGKDTDVYLKTNSNQFYQRIGGSWTVFYTFPAAVSGTSFRYGAGVPLNSLGVDGDSYINTLTGIFYLRSSGTYAQVFSMATGPQGPQGTAGTNGTNGTDGNTILYGNGNPSNGLGINGNFYLNTATYDFFGPKASGVWPVGVSLIAPIVIPVIYNLPANSETPVIIDFDNSTIKIGTASPVSIGADLTNYQSNPEVKFKLVIDSTNTKPIGNEGWISNEEWTDNTYTSLVALTLQPDTDTGLSGGLTLDNINIIIKP